MQRFINREFVTNVHVGLSLFDVILCIVVCGVEVNIFDIIQFSNHSHPQI